MDSDDATSSNIVFPCLLEFPDKEEDGQRRVHYYFSRLSHNSVASTLFSRRPDLRSANPFPFSRKTEPENDNSV